MIKISEGKVRDVYQQDDSHLIIVTTDRISAFDVILSSTIPQKGAVLNQLSNFWFDLTKDIIPNHMVSTNLQDMPAEITANPEYYEGRTIKVKKLKMLSFEVIVRGYIFGNMWNAYQKGEAFCGHNIAGTYQLAEKLAEPIITPSTKAENGEHDVYISLEEFRSAMGAEKADEICAISLALYKRCYDYAAARGIIIADTKFEFGYDENGNLVLADEIFTPDSSRFWDAAAYQVGQSPASYDKQFVRDWLIAQKLDGVTPAPALPAEVVEATSKIYQECVTKIIG